MASNSSATTVTPPQERLPLPLEKCDRDGCDQYRTAPICCLGRADPNNAGRFYHLCFNNNDSLPEHCTGFKWEPVGWEPPPTPKKCPGPYCRGAGKPNTVCALLLCKTCCIKASLAYQFLRKCAVASHKEGLNRELTVSVQIPSSVFTNAAAPSTQGFNPTPIGAYLSTTYIQNLEASSALRSARAQEAERMRQARVEADRVKVLVTWWDKDGEVPKFVEASTTNGILVPQQHGDLCALFDVDKKPYQYLDPDRQVWIQRTRASPAIVLGARTEVYFASAGISSGLSMPTSSTSLTQSPSKVALHPSETLSAPQTPTKRRRPNDNPSPATPTQRTPSLSPTKRLRPTPSSSQTSHGRVLAKNPWPVRYQEMAECLERAILLFTDGNLSKEAAYWKVFPTFETYVPRTFYKYLEAYNGASQDLKDAFEEQDGTWHEFVALYEQGTTLHDSPPQ